MDKIGLEAPRCSTGTCVAAHLHGSFSSSLVFGCFPRFLEAAPSNKVLFLKPDFRFSDALLYLNEASSHNSLNSSHHSHGDKRIEWERAAMAGKGRRAIFDLAPGQHFHHRILIKTRFPFFRLTSGHGMPLLSFDNLKEKTILP